MLRCAIITSHRSVSLQRVANDIATVLKENSIEIAKTILYPDADPRLYRDVDVAVTVMTFDPAWVTPYLFLCRELNNKGKTCLFYTTVEGRIRRFYSDEWIYRDLAYIANSMYTKTKLVEAGAKVLNVVYHGIDISKVKAFKWMARNLRKKLDLREDDFVVGYVAGGYMRKAHDLFAEVIKIVHSKDKSIKFVVLTDKKGSEHYNDVEDVIVIPDFGNLTDDTLYGLYHVFDLYVQASLAEGFGLPVLEALAAGKPVVHADYAPLTEVTDEKTSFRVPVRAVVYKRETGAIEYELHYYDPEEFAEMILYAKDEVIKNRDEYTARCIERASVFDMRKTYRLFIDMLLSGGIEYVREITETTRASVSASISRGSSSRAERDSSSVERPDNSSSGASIRSGSSTKRTR